MTASNQDTNANSNDDDEYNEVSMSQHIFEQINSFVNSKDSTETKVQKAKSLLPYIQELDGYLSFSEGNNEGQLPALEWNSHFRKAYTVLLWIRPCLGGEKHTTMLEDQAPPPRRVLYRFSTSHEDHNGVGVCVTVGDWRVASSSVGGAEKRSTSSTNSSTSRPSNKQEDDAVKVQMEENGTTTATASSLSSVPPKRRLQTSLTAFALPHDPKDPMASAGEHGAYVTVPLELVENEWALIGITHIYPYLKRPQWTICIDGKVTASGELAYPVLDRNPIMQYNTLFHNVVKGGAVVINNETPDFKKTASELQTMVYRRLKLSLHLASFSLSNEALSSTIQALLAQAGPTFSLQQNGAIPTLPPVANWTKGSSLEGPNVGIPLVVHGQALQLQQLASSCVVWGSAVEARLLGASDPFGLRGTIQRIICRMPYRMGTTQNAPRVGLIQPTAPSPQQHHRSSVESSTDGEAPISLTVLGSCSVHHNLSDYLLHSPDVSNVDTQLFHCTKHLSLLIDSQSFDCQILLPFFLSLPPPGIMFGLQTPLYDASLRHLYSLHTNQGEFAAALLNLFTAALVTGGGRFHEQLLQNGSLHVLASTLRQSLVRAQVMNVDKHNTFETFHQANANKQTTSMAFLPTSPTKIPKAIAEAAAELVGACCGPPATLLENLSPALQIQRTSDLALTAVFGIALDLEIWGRNLDACELMLGAVAARYGGPCITAGYILRSQISVQYFLDLIKSQLDRETPSSQLERVGNSCSLILQSMLLSSLSNRRSISQGEHDISACMGALSDCPLGSVGAHVIFSALMGVLNWCEVFLKEGMQTTSDEDHKVQVATRLGRNLLMGQFHDVVAPMLLSRTVFCGERTLIQEEEKHRRESKYDGILSWQLHWRLGLQTFSWVSSIAGPEGILAARSLGSLLLASGLAGSLNGALESSDETLASTLFLPPPATALTMAVTSRKSEWSYTDLLADRLEVMMPLLPGLVVSILSHPSDVTAETRLSGTALTVLSKLVTAVDASFYRVYGGLMHTAVTGKDYRKLNSRPSRLNSRVVIAAKEYVPHLLVVAMILENHIQIRRKVGGDDVVEVLREPRIVDQTKRAEDDAWVEVSPTVNESFQSDGPVEFPEDISDAETMEGIVKRLQASEKSIMTNISELLSSAMRSGGGEASTLLWRNVLSTLKESVAYAARDTDKKEVADTNKDRKSKAEALAHNVLCRLAAMILVKSLNRDYQWEVWSEDLSSAVSRLCLLVEEKELLQNPLGVETSDGRKVYTKDQVVLLCALLNLLNYGRDTTGWCQLILPSPPISSPQVGETQRSGKGDKLSQNALSTGGAPAASKLMLPVLQPCLRVVIECIGNIQSNTRILIPGGLSQKSADPKEASQSGNTQSLLHIVTSELRGTLTAAIVGLSFPSARDVALQALASLRRAMASFKNGGDDEGLQLCGSLFCTVTEEITVRYQGERRRRETALFDAYEEHDGKNASDATAKGAAADSQEIESMILGDDFVPATSEGEQYLDGGGLFNKGSSDGTLTDPSKPDSRKAKSSEDFVLFATGRNGKSNGEGGARMQWSKYEGFGSTLEKWSQSSKVGGLEYNEASSNEALAILKPYLDAWDDNAAIEAAESDLVELFDFSVTISARDVGVSGMDDDEGEEILQLPILGSETAADSMSTFIEFAAVEKARLSDVTGSFLPNHRNSCNAFAERFCWARYFELVNQDGGSGMDEIWERGIADGNRDIRSRLVTIPCTPQFRRYLPSYLDHSAQNEQSSQTTRTSAKSEVVAKDGEDASAEMDKFTKTLLATGKLEIVDITKKEIIEDDEPELVMPQISMDDDGMFGDDLLEVPTSNVEPSKPKHHVAESDSGSTLDSTATDEDSNQQSNTDDLTFDKIKLGSSHYNITSSAFASPPDNSSSTLSLIHSAAAGMIEQHVENCVHVKAEGSRKCSMLLTSTHLILEYDADTDGLYEGEMMAVHEEADRQKLIEEAGGWTSGKDEDKLHEELEKRQRVAAALRPKSIRWNLSELSHVYLRRYRLRDSSLEMFYIPSGGTSFGGYGLYSPSTSLFLDFGPGYEGNARRDEAAFAIMKRAPPQAIKQWPDRGGQFLHEQLSRLTMGWVEGRITNFDYLLHLNMLAGRSYNDICQYPVMPWVLSDYRSEDIPDLCDPNNFRDLTKPMGALNPERLEDFIERFNTFSDPSIPPFMYGSHYSTSAGVVLHFLVRLHPFAGLHRQLQGGHFDVADRLFSSVPRTWEMCTGSSAAEVKELTPEWYCNPAFLKNTNRFKLGTSQDGEVLGEVDLPPWAKGKPETFVEVMRNALESDVCSEMLPDWIDLIFGRKQQGPEAIAAHNVFFYLTYYGSVDVASIQDESLRQATELQIAHFGQCPMQLFVRPHVRRIKQQSFRRLSFYQILSAYTHGVGRSTEDKEPEDRMNRVFGEPLYLPFFSAPLSHWVHLDAPPPGPHAALVGVRLAGTDRCLAVDSQGVFHCFRWAWKPGDDRPTDGADAANSCPVDTGCFIAQRELPRFRVVPRLVHTPRPDETPAVAISKTLFAGRSVLLVISDGDGRGGMAMQLVDPAKGSVRGEAVVGAVHSAKISCIATDPIGTAAGHGGVGGELAIVGSLDGCASIWRFMSSHYLPLRPRVRLGGHGGAKVCAVGLSAAIHIAATVSAERCCLHSIGNGNLIRSIKPPTDTLDIPDETDVEFSTIFADTPALAISVQGFVVTVCETRLKSRSSPSSNRSVFTLHLFSLEGVSLGSKPLEKWRGIPHKMACTPDGTAVLVCAGRGVTIHRLSAITPLEFIDEWHVTETDELNNSIAQAWDIDLGPSLNRPVVAAAASSHGVLRLHALPGITAYSKRHMKSGLSQSVGSALARPARRLRNAVGKGLGLGSKVVGVSKEIGKEVTTDVKERGVGGFLGNMMFRKTSK